MDTIGLVDISEASIILGVSRPTVYSLIKEGKLFIITIGNHPFLARGNLRPYIVHKCSTCLHHLDKHCACREISDMVHSPNKCSDWISIERS